jgi:hypothetical protein
MEYEYSRNSLEVNPNFRKSKFQDFPRAIRKGQNTAPCRHASHASVANLGRYGSGANGEGSGMQSWKFKRHMFSN